MWQERYWNKLCEVRAHTFYYQEYLNDSRRMSGWLKAFLAITSSGSIAGWAVWQEYQFFWGAIIALSQVINAVKRFLPFEKRISVLGIVYSRLTALAVSVENDWYDVSEGHWSTKEINRKITEIKQNETTIYDELNTVYMPEKMVFLNIAEKKADQYLKYHFKQVYFKKGRLDHALLQKEYIGFVVIKPLPKTIFGRTCLKTYDGDQGRRHYITRNYDVNLYGLELKVDSLAYQEQDRIVSACATSALWSVFQYTGVQFQHPILSPLEITKAACINFPSEQRSIPNDGLEIDQMVHSIYSVGLEPYIVQVRGIEDVKNETYALLKGGLPMILGLALVNTAKVNDKPDYEVITAFDNHAVAVSGYSRGGSCVPSAESGILLESSRLDKLYCHDDQIGPFSRIIFHGNKIKAPVNELSLETREYETLLSSCPRDDYDWDKGMAISVPATILAPIYHKIRIPYHVILSEIIKLDFSLEDLRKNKKLPLEERMSWDIYLTRNSTFKSELIENKKLPQHLKELFLFQNMPRYIWRATAIHNGEKVMDVIFDATDLEQGKKLHCLLVYSQQIYEAICTHFDEKREMLKNKDLWSPIFDWFYDKYGKDMKIQ